MLDWSQGFNKENIYTRLPEFGNPTHLLSSTRGRKKTKTIRDLFKRKHFLGITKKKK